MTLIADGKPVPPTVNLAHAALFAFTLARHGFNHDTTVLFQQPYDVIEDLLLSLIDFHQHQYRQYIIANHGRHAIPGDLNRTMTEMLATASQYLVDEYPPQPWEIE